MCKKEDKEINVDIEKMSAEELKKEVARQCSLKKTAVVVLGGLALYFGARANRAERMLRTAAIMLATQDRQFDRLREK